MVERGVAEFMRDGYTVVRQAVAPDVVAACRSMIGADLHEQNVDIDDPSTWSRPLVRINCPEGEPFAEAGLSPVLHAAYDALIGRGRWKARAGVGGTIPARFPSEEYPGEIGWHIEGTRWNGTELLTDVWSRGRGLLALFLFSDVGPDDAPTRLALGSHHFVPPILLPYGDAGAGGDAVPAAIQPSVLCRTVAHATGRAGDVFLVHPFMLHTATWPHRGHSPRLVAQPGVDCPDGFRIDGTDESPVGRMIAAALAA